MHKHLRTLLFALAILATSAITPVLLVTGQFEGLVHERAAMVTFMGLTSFMAVMLTGIWCTQFIDDAEARGMRMERGNRAMEAEFNAAQEREQAPAKECDGTSYPCKILNRGLDHVVFATGHTMACTLPGEEW